MSEATLARFVQIRDRAERDTLDSTTCSSELTSLGQTERISSFNLALDTWMTVFDKHQLRDDLQRVTQADAACLKRIKLVRKQGVILSSAYTYFDSRHYVPTPHYKLMKKLGKLNDPISPEQFEEQKRNALSFVYAYPTPSETDFSPETDSAYLEYIHHISYELIRTFQVGMLPIKEFHDARQAFREQMNLMQLRAVSIDTEESYISFRNWFVISKLLGEIKDGAEMQTEGDREEYLKIFTTIDPVLLSATLHHLAQNN